MKSKQLHLARGFGAASRINFDFKKLESYGWKVKIRESIVSGIKKTLFSYETPIGKVLKSAKDAEKELRKTGIYELVLKSQENEAPQTEEVKDGCAYSSTECVFHRGVHHRGKLSKKDQIEIRDQIKTESLIPRCEICQKTLHGDIIGKP
jgi:hypothetical protein